jgi:hypothetical protein
MDPNLIAWLQQMFGQSSNYSGASDYQQPLKQGGTTGSPRMPLIMDTFGGGAMPRIQSDPTADDPFGNFIADTFGDNPFGNVVADTFGGGMDPVSRLAGPNSDALEQGLKDADGAYKVPANEFFMTPPDLIDSVSGFISPKGKIWTGFQGHADGAAKAYMTGLDDMGDESDMMREGFMRIRGMPGKYGSSIAAEVSPHNPIPTDDQMRQLEALLRAQPPTNLVWQSGYDQGNTLESFKDFITRMMQ